MASESTAFATPNAKRDGSKPSCRLGAVLDEPTAQMCNQENVLHQIFDLVLWRAHSPQESRNKRRMLGKQLASALAGSRNGRPRGCRWRRFHELLQQSNVQGE